MRACGQIVGESLRGNGGRSMETTCFASSQPRTDMRRCISGEREWMVNVKVREASYLKLRIGAKVAERHARLELLELVIGIVD
eukprot:scaffold64407_cov24-Tisochrysis_lutea.AAC.6